MCKHQFAKIHPDEPCAVCFYDALGSMTKQEVIEAWKNANNK